MHTLKAQLTELANDPRYDKELWSFAYEVYPYLKDTSDEELDYRYDCLCRNIAHLFNDQRYIIPEKVAFVSSWWWLSIYEHTLFEYKTRKREPIESCYSIPTDPIWPQGFTPTTLGSSGYIVRYSRHEFIKKTLETGHLRFAAASSYSECPLDKARFDNECEVCCYSPGSFTTITTEGGEQIPIIGELKKSRKSQTDYNLLCFSREFDPRLADIFSATACLVIWDIEEFEHRVSTVLRLSRLPFSFHSLPVLYYDSRNVRPQQLMIPGSCKEFSFAYQREHRLIFQPNGVIPKSRALELMVGPLEDIAGMYSISGQFLGIGSDLRR